MKTYEVEMLFEHTAIITLKAKNEKEAMKLAEKIQFSDHPRKISESDGDFGALLSVLYPKEVK